MQKLINPNGWEFDKTVNIQVEAYKIIYNFLVGKIWSAVQVLSASLSSSLDRLWS